MMANGTLVRVLIHTDVTKYLYFKAVDGSYVYNKGKVYLHFYHSENLSGFQFYLIILITLLVENSILIDSQSTCN